jgi:hypothetical protein
MRYTAAWNITQKLGRRIAEAFGIDLMRKRLRLEEIKKTWITQKYTVLLQLFDKI